MASPCLSAVSTGCCSSSPLPSKRNFPLTRRHEEEWRHTLTHTHTEREGVNSVTTWHCGAKCCIVLVASPLPWSTHKMASRPCTDCNLNTVSPLLCFNGRDIETHSDRGGTSRQRSLTPWRTRVPPQSFCVPGPHVLCGCGRLGGSQEAHHSVLCSFVLSVGCVVLLYPHPPVCWACVHLAAP